MRSAAIYLCFLAASFLFSSCAVHAHFPFICFRGECIKDQWSIGKVKKPDLRAFKKRVKVKTRMLKRKVSKSKPRDSIKFPELPSLDTTQVQMGDAVVYTRFVLFFRVKDQKEYSDTTIIAYTSEFRDIRQDDKDRLSYLLQKINPGRIELIVVQQIKKTVANEPEDHHLVKRKERAIRRFLNTEGVQKSKIVIVPP